ncbi:hypothetical protein BCR36DRAFT_337329 [Piromyces finnis]|uniref:Coth-domain-containing protein n=1 Tax=Piromyces finnis TaxID=1754191 RepID=A0A1Y1UXX5_9FUNG|nr:hypothetical protein BCR36DRAFT_337329 [Piromyces finnis]|eukprot:ORX42556.1 hypothetical protein BCR36DRAFT_337329 [Piromyces finnis]
MRIRSFGIIISSVVTLVNAKSHFFNVISILGEGSSIGVKYNGIVKPLAVSTFPLFKGTIEADDIKEYKYVSLDSNNNVLEEETINRVYSDENSNINEVYNRSNKEVTITELSQPFKPMFKMGSKKFQPIPKNKIYNIYAKCLQEDYEYLTNNPFVDNLVNTMEVNCTINIISPDSAYQSDGSLHVIGYGSRQYKKLSFGMKFNKKFLGRKGIKLRGMPNDASLVREPLTTELYKAVGVPVQEGTYARLYINNDIYGLYNMVDSFNDRWVGAYVHGDAKSKIGFSYKFYSSTPNGPYASLRYFGESVPLYRDSGTYALDEYEKKDIKEDDSQAQWSPLIRFTKLFHDWVESYGNDNSEKAIDELEKFLNIESLLRLLVIETLIMALDNFWLALSNVALYYNPERNNYQFLPYDFDLGLIGSKDSVLIEKVGYLKDCITWAESKVSIVDHYFTSNIMKHPQIKKRYDVILAITTREIFHSKYLTPYIHSLTDLIMEDVEWNFETINHLSIAYSGKEKHFTLQDFLDNLDYDKTNYDKAARSNLPQLGLSEFIDLRGDYCRAYTSNVDISNNVNISDDVDVSSGSSSLVKSSSLLLTFACLLFLFLA